MYVPRYVVLLWRSRCVGSLCFWPPAFLLFPPIRDLGYWLRTYIPDPDRHRYRCTYNRWVGSWRFVGLQLAVTERVARIVQKDSQDL
ncbi:hypothetical protein GGR54DRAFT_602477 [Hypoxylon sp. NC1633]|nr:hypothetical protein GGR54DRAFT_602477 [Hypoxylon sp. NC1633]